MSNIYIVKGGNSLKGEVKIKGAKNAILAIIPATLVVRGKIKLKNIGNITDVKKALLIMKEIGVKCKGKITINNKGDFDYRIKGKEASSFRASYYFMGALLATKNRVEIDCPGGCCIGERPIDIHLEGFRKLGCIVKEENNTIKIEGKLKGTIIDVKKSVGATINMILASLGATGKTELIKPALEPEVIDVINFLKMAGYDIVVKENIVINSEGLLEKSFTYRIIPDRIEALTYMIIGLLLGEIKIKNICLEHIEQIVYLLIRNNARIRIKNDCIIAKQSDLLPMNIITDYYPGIPTDIQQILTTLLAVTKGVSLVTENIFENRFMNCLELNKMGADIIISGKTITINGVKNLKGKKLIGKDLRGTMSLIVAALIAKGTSFVYNEYHIERGYDNFLKKIKGLGAKIKKK